MVTPRSESGGSGLTLGWLLAIIIVGGILLFTCVGILFAWLLKNKRLKALRVYSMGDGVPLSTNGLTRRGLLRADSTNFFSDPGTSFASLSGLSLNKPQVPPPIHFLDRNKAVDERRTRKTGKDGIVTTLTPRTASGALKWVDDETLHGPKMGSKLRESWFGRDSWFFRITPTVPDVEKEAVELPANGEDKSAPSSPQKIQKTRPGERTRSESLEKLNSAKRRGRGGSDVTALDLEAQRQRDVIALAKYAPDCQPVNAIADVSEEERGRARTTRGANHLRSATETSLQNILQSTEQRLRDGSSRSPAKSLPPNLAKLGSPTKTPRSPPVTVPAPKSVASPDFGLPAKRLSADKSTTSLGHKRNSSIHGLGSAENSLILKATKELVLPGGSSSPSRLKGREWRPSAEKSRTRSATLESQASSTLSTLYSEDEASHARNEPLLGPLADDPFVERKTQQSLRAVEPAVCFGQNPVRLTRSRTLGAADVEDVADPSAFPPPLQLMSSNSLAMSPSRWTIQVERKRASTMAGPNKHDSNLLVAGGQDYDGMRDMSGSSYTSMVTATTADDETEVPETDTPRALSPDGSEDLQHHGSSSTPRTKGDSEAYDQPSSPLNEDDILSLLLSSNTPRRALPIPPQPVQPVRQSPRLDHPSPSSRRARQQQRRVSSVSVNSSHYEDNGPVRGRAVSRSIALTEQALEDTIGELRRMESIRSAYSTTSTASAILESSTSLQNLRGGGFSPQHVNGRNSDALGRKNYLNLGTPPKGKHLTPERNIGSAGSPKRSIGKENVGSKSITSPAAAAANARGGDDSTRTSLHTGTSGSPMGKGRRKLNRVEELAVPKRVEKRASSSSLGLYDQDGFLRDTSTPTPTQEADKQLCAPR